MNRSRQLEYRALTLLDALRAGRRLAEADALAATFRTWPGPPRGAARRLAAHANAARGRDVLWLIGVEGDGKVRGADFAGFEPWLAELSPFFDGLAPRLSAFRVPTDSGTAQRPARQMVAVLVETERAPFVVHRGLRSREMAVPWFAADRQQVQPAGRLELIKLLSPLQDLPRLEILEAELTFYKNTLPSYSSKAAFRWTLDGSVYVMPHADQRVVVPLHRCRAGIGSAHGNFSSQSTEVNLTADKGSPAIRLTESAALIEGLGRVFIYCSGSTNQAEVPIGHPVTFTVDMVPVGSEQAASALTTMRPAPVAESNQAGRWKL